MVNRTASSMSAHDPIAAPALPDLREATASHAEERWAAEATLAECSLRGVDLSNVKARGARLDRVALHDCRLVGLSVEEGGLRDVLLSGCRLGMASFARAGLRAVRFEGCDLRETSFLGARMRDVVFEGCRLEGADFREARMTDCAIRGSSLDGVLGVGALAGCRMPWSDLMASAGALAAALEIEVEPG